MLKISRDSEINIINILIDNDIITGIDLIKIKKASVDTNKSQIDTLFELELANEQQILDILIKEQGLETVELSSISPSEEVKKYYHPTILTQILLRLLN